LQQLFELILFVFAARLRRAANTNKTASAESGKISPKKMVNNED